MREQNSVNTSYDQDDTEDDLLNIKSYNSCTVCENLVYFTLVIQLDMVVLETFKTKANIFSST